MIKEVQFFGKTASGIYVQSLFDTTGGLVKTAGAPVYADWSTGEEIQKYISGLSAQDRKENLYVLVNALGAGEYYGSNINADYFPWNALAHEGKDYGYQTFLDGHAFQHHINKDPSRAFGQPVLSVLNHQMKRVELIVKLNREKANIEQAGGVLSRIEQGEFPDVSMGCKVPFDVCYVCGNKSKTKDDYCTHMRPSEDMRGVFGPNKILANGMRCCVINTLPRFFDISFVFIGADKTAKVMAKLASKKHLVCMGDVCSVDKEAAVNIGGDKISPLSKAINRKADKKKDQIWSMNNNYFEWNEAPYHADPENVIKDQVSNKAASACNCECGGVCEGGYEKIASAFGVKHAQHEKFSEIVKNIPAGPFAMHTLSKLEKSEPDLPKDVLNNLGENYPIGASCSLLGSLGIVLKPQEFQRIVLIRMGEGDKADSLDHANSVFKPSSEFSDLSPSGTSDGVDKILEMLKGIIRERTAFGQPFVMRVMIAKNSPNFSLPTRKTVEDPLLNKIGAAYNSYRRDLLMKLSQAKEVVENDPRLREVVLGESIADMFTKSANIPVLSLDSMTYILGAHLPDRNLLCSTATAEAMAANNPSLLDMVESDLA